MSTNNKTIKNIEDYPITMNAKHVEEILGISRAQSYETMHQEDFPKIKTYTYLLKKIKTS